MSQNLNEDERLHMNIVEKGYRYREKFQIEITLFI